MAKIISIEGVKVKVGGDDGKITTVPIASLTFPNPKVGDQVEIFKDGNNIIVNKTKAKNRGERKIKINKKAVIISGSIIVGIILIVCAVLFLPMAFDEDLRSQSSYPKYFSNLKEEKVAFTRALQSCNEAAESKMRSNGVTVEYGETDINIIRKGIGGDYEDEAAYIYLSDVNPTGGDTEYKSYGLRDYDCETNMNGNSVRKIYILWDDKD